MRRLHAIAVSAALILLAQTVWPQSPESLGPSSRRTGLAISEIMYRPSPDELGRNLQFIEMFNTGLVPENLGGYRLSGAIDYIFPEDSAIAPGGFLLVAPAPSDIESAYGISTVLGGFENPLPRSEGLLQLRNRAGAILLEVAYRDREPWPVAAAGAGHSLVLARPSFGEGNPKAWAPSALVGGSPGAAEPPIDDPLRHLLINEFLASPGEGGQDYIELYNNSPEELDISGCALTDSRSQDKFLFPPGTTLGPFAHLGAHREQLGFGLASTGEQIFLRNPARTRVLDAVRFDGQARGIPMGRFPDGAPGFQALEHPTPGAANAPILKAEVVINEIMYHPPSRDDRDSYVELHNRSSEPVTLAGWRLDDGIRFQFPEHAAIPPGGYAVVAKDAARLIGRYSALNAQNTFGNFNGRLSNRGERISLMRPLDPEEGSETMAYVLVNEVTYQDGGRWPGLADGGGSSLELIDPRSDNRLAPNWEASDETAKGQWTVVEHTGALDHGTGAPTALHILLMGAGECLVDNVEVFVQGGPNLVANSGFESGVAGWTFEGTHHQSRWEPSEGYQSGGSLRVHALARGDTGANRIRATLASAPSPGSVVTIRANVRWLSGAPEILFRLYGNYLEAAGRLQMPPHLGTPGEHNSRAVLNSGPAITEVSHAPVLPQAGEAVRVAARARDPDGITQVRLRYRIDPSSSFTTIPMRDDGAGGDLLPNDGVYTALIPGQPSGRLAAFHIEAIDGASPSRATNFPAHFPEQECLIRWGESHPPPGLGTYRLWMTQAVHDRWSANSPLDNTPYDVTFVYNDERVIYNAGALFAGSPHIAPSFNRPTGNLSGYVIIMPKDDRFLGVTDVRLDWPSRDDTAQQEPFAYFLARELDLPYSHRRFIHLHVNGVTSTQRGSVYEDSQQVNTDFISAWAPEGEGGELFKIEQWFEFSNSGGRTHTGPPRLGNYTTTSGVKKTARYRWNWLKRAVKDSAHHYDSLFALADAANAPAQNYVRGLEELADIEQWMRIFAVEHMVVNFDSYGSDIGKNMYAYKPPNGPWRMFMWDIDWVMTASAQHGYGPTSPLMYLGPARFGEGNRDPAIARMYNEPQFQRAYWRAIQDAVNGPLRSEIVSARMDATYDALAASGVTRSAGRSLASPQAVKSWIAQRRAYLQQQLQTIEAPFTITSPAGDSVMAEAHRLAISGTAPIAAQRITINGLPAEVAWTSVTNWVIETPVRNGTHPLRIETFDLRMNPVPNGASEFTVTYHGPDIEPHEHIAINEWMASNRSIPNPLTGEFDDWFELFNPASTPADLSGFHLSDSSASPLRFTLPPRAIIPSGGFLLVWADGTGAGLLEGNLHVNFRLNRSGEEILLSAPDGRLIDAVAFGSQSPDISQGRWPDGALPPFHFFSRTTPGASNLLSETPDHPITIIEVGMEATGVRVTWSSIPGRQYRLLYKEDLDAAEWRLVEGSLTAFDATTEKLDPRPAGQNVRRFYQVLQLD
jgi:hypothetical protein